MFKPVAFQPDGLGSGLEIILKTYLIQQRIKQPEQLDLIQPSERHQCLHFCTTCCGHTHSFLYSNEKNLPELHNTTDKHVIIIKQKKRYNEKSTNITIPATTAIY
ncbi:unnamed protein product [Rhizophagus irregularis]|nr:unnamed protein product [Rhizophagus irregularis]